MKITEKKIGKTGLMIECVINESDYSDLVNKSLSNSRKKMNVPGFRIGKVPMGLVKKQYGNSVKVEEINKLLSQNIQSYISDNKILMIGGPIPIEEDIDFVNNIDFIFKYELGLQPIIDLSSVEKSKIDLLEINPDKEKVQEHIESLRKRYGNVTNPDVISEGDMLNVELTELDANNKPKVGGIVKSTSMLLEKVEDKNIKKKFLASKKSDNIIFQPKKAFTNQVDLSSMLGVKKEELDGLMSDFNCQIQNISRLMPSELNNDFFKKAYPDKEINTKKEFESIVIEELKALYVRESDNKFFNDASSLFIEKTKMNLPEDFLNKWLRLNAKKEFNDDEFAAEFKNYLKYISWQLIENTICQDNNIKVTNNELRDFAKSQMLQQMKNYGNVNLGDKEIDGIVTNVLNNKQESEKMMNELIAIRLIDYFKSKMKINRKTITFNEFVKLADNQK